MTEQGVEFETINYIEKPLSAIELKRLLQLARLRATDVLRTKEDAYKRYIAGRDLTDDKVLEIMARHPELVQRPIVVRGSKAVLARPVENLSRLGLK